MSSLLLAASAPDGTGPLFAVKGNSLTGRLEVENYVWSGTVWVPVTSTQPIVLNADARTAALSSGLWTLDSTTVVESIAIPNFARGFRLRPSSDVKFAVGEDPVANGAETLTVGNTAYANETEVRLLDPGTGRTLRLLTTVAAATCGVGFF
jgi:hypothetical protein